MGEVISDEWELVHTEVVNEENEEFDFTKLAEVKRDDAAKPSKSSLLRTIRGIRSDMLICPLESLLIAESSVLRWKL